MSRPFALFGYVHALTIVLLMLVFHNGPVEAAQCLPAGMFELEPHNLGSRTMANWYDYYSYTSHFPFAKDNAVAMAFGYTLVSASVDRLGFLLVNDRALGPTTPNRRVIGNITFSAAYSATSPFTMLADDASEWTYNSAKRTIFFNTIWPSTNTDGLALDNLVHPTQNNFSMTVTYSYIDPGIESVDLWTFPGGGINSNTSYTFGRSQLMAGIRFDLYRLGTTVAFQRFGVNMFVPPQSYPDLVLNQVVAANSYTAVLIDVTGSSEDYNAWTLVQWDVTLVRWADGFTYSQVNTLADSSYAIYVNGVRSGTYLATVTMTDKCGISSTKSANVTVCAPWMFMCGPEVLYNVTVTPSSGLAVVGTKITVTFWTNVQSLKQLSCRINDKLMPSTGLVSSGYIHTQTYVPVDWDPAFGSGNLTVLCQFNATLGTIFTVKQTTDRNSLRGFFDPPIILDASVSPSFGWVKIGDRVNITFLVNDFVSGVSCFFNGYNITSTWQAISSTSPLYSTFYIVQEGHTDIAAGASTIICTVKNIINIYATTWALSANSLAIDANKPVLMITLAPDRGTVAVGDSAQITLTSTMGEPDLIIKQCWANNVNITQSVVNFQDGRYAVTYVLATNDSMFSAGGMAFSCIVADQAGNQWTGTALPTNSLASKVNCAPGTRWTGRLLCVQCPVGFFSATMNSLTCSPCATGTFINSTSSFQCTACPVGSYTDLVGQSSCKLCAAGSVSASAGSSSCSLCPVGYFQTATGSSSCLPCGLNTYASTSGSVNCSLCPAGLRTISLAATSVSACRPCEAGFYTVTVNSSTTCLPCPSGTYSNTTGAQSCVLCPAGTANPRSGSTSIIDCEECACNTYSSGGAAICSSCPLNQYSSRSSAACSSCNSSLLSNQESIVLRNGYFNEKLNDWTTNMVLDDAAGHTLFGSRTGFAPRFINNGSQAGFMSQMVVINQDAPFTMVIQAFSKISTLVTTAGGSAEYMLRVVVGYSNSSIPPLGLSASFSLSSRQWQLRSIFVPFVSLISYVNISMTFKNIAGTAWFDDVSVSILEYTACACAPGEYYSRQYKSCQPCATGFQCCRGQLLQCDGLTMSFGGADVCRPCMDGWVCVEGIGHPCNKLNTTAATFSSNNVCNPCPAGHACRDGKANMCLSGTVPNFSSTMCDPCIPGTYAGKGSTECKACSALGANRTSGFARDFCV